VPRDADDEQIKKAYRKLRSNTTLTEILKIRKRKSLSRRLPRPMKYSGIAKSGNCMIDSATQASKGPGSGGSAVLMTFFQVSGTYSRIFLASEGDPIADHIRARVPVSGMT
jgi:hypothetical protein